LNRGVKIKEVSGRLPNYFAFRACGGRIGEKDSGMSIPIVWGTRMMGKVDAVPGVGHVATKFFYLQYVPLIPVETYLVFREVGEQIHGVLSVPNSFSSPGSGRAS
jgi:hypothetical protein